MNGDNFKLDVSQGMGYNVGNELYEAVADNILSRPQIIKLEEQKPLYERCNHEQLVANPDDVIGDAIYHGCSNPKCGVGFYIRQK